MKEKKQLFFSSLISRYGIDVTNKANGIINTAKKTNITDDKILETLPSGELLIKVIPCIIDIIKWEMDEGRKASDHFRTTINTIVNALNKMIDDGEVTSEERIKIASYLRDLGIIMAKVEGNGQMWRTIRWGLGILGAIVIVVIGGKGKNDNI